MLFKGLQLVHEIILRIIELELLYDMGIFFTRHTRLSSSFDLPRSSHAVLAVFFDWYKISIAPEADMKPRILCLFLL